MKNYDFTLELSDGTRMEVATALNARYPDIKAFFLPDGAMTPFSWSNLPSSRRNEERASGSRNVMGAAVRYSG